MAYLLIRSPYWTVESIVNTTEDIVAEIDNLNIKMLSDGEVIPLDVKSILTSLINITMWTIYDCNDKYVEFTLMGFENESVEI